MPEPTKRPRYFDHQLLGQEDLSLAQVYDMGRRRQHNRSLHTWGVCEGLTLSFSAGASVATVSAGAAIDSLGQEIVLGTPTQTPDVTGSAGKSVYVLIGYNEVATDPRTTNGVTDNSRVTEAPLIWISETPPTVPSTQLILGQLTVGADGKITAVSDGLDPNRRRWAGAVGGSIIVDSRYTNNGTISPGVLFGSGASGEGISSKRTPGGNQYGLDFYTAAGTLRMSITNGGNVGIGTPAPGSRLQVEGDVRAVGLVVDKGAANTGALSPGLTFVVGSGEGIASKRSAGGNQYGIDFYTGNTARLSVTNAGRVGIGSMSPTAELSIVAAGAQEVAGTAASTALRVSAGPLGTAAGNELAVSSFGFHSGNHTALGIRAVRVSAGSDWTTSAIGLGMDVDNTVRAGGASLYLHANGNVGVATNNPRTRLDVNGGAAIGGFAIGTNVPGINNPFPYETIGLSNPSWNLRFASINQILFHPGNNASPRVQIDATGRIGVAGQSPTPHNTGWGGGLHTYDLEAEQGIWCRAFVVDNAVTIDHRAPTDTFTFYRNPNIGSDRRLKKNISPLTGVLQKIAAVNAVEFHRVPLSPDGPRTCGREIGVIAQEVEALFPELVKSMGPEGYKGVDYGGLTAVLLQAIRELLERVQMLEARFTTVRDDRTQHEVAPIERRR
jgi:endosialidase-like protein